MYSSVSTRDKNISVQFRENMIDILSDKQLFELVTEMPEAATEELVSAIKKNIALNSIEILVFRTRLWPLRYGDMFLQRNLPTR